MFLISCQSSDIETKKDKNLYDCDVEQRFNNLGVELQEIKLSEGLSIELAIRKGDLIYLSGNGPKLSSGERIEGKVGEDLTIEEGYEAA